MFKLNIDKTFNLISIINNSETFQNSVWMKYEISEWDMMIGVIDLNSLITYSIILFLLSFFGLVFNKQQNIIVFMLFIELLLFSLGFMSIVFSLLWASPEGQVFALYIMSIAVAESAVGLGILIATFRINQRIELDNFSFLRG